MTQNDIMELQFDNITKEKTILNALEKLRYTQPHRMGNRTPLALLDNLIMGDLAKNALCYQLRLRGRNVRDYDEIRIDNFQNPDPGWDLIIGNSQVTLEVKSSQPPQGDGVDNIINNRDVKIFASRDEGATYIPINSLESTIHLQVYFFNAPTYSRSDYNTIDALYSHLLSLKIENTNNNGNLIPVDYSGVIREVEALIHFPKYNPLFFGWAYKTEIQDNTWEFTRHGVRNIYRKCPIRLTHTFEELLIL